MNEELLQQAINQLKMFKDAKVETVSIENTDYTDGTTRFSFEVIYEDNFRAIKTKDEDMVASVN